MSLRLGLTSASQANHPLGYLGRLFQLPSHQMMKSNRFMQIFDVASLSQLSFSFASVIDVSNRLPRYKCIIAKSIISDRLL